MHTPEWLEDTYWIGDGWVRIRVDRETVEDDTGADPLTADAFETWMSYHRDRIVRSARTRLPQDARDGAVVLGPGMLVD